MSKDELPSPWQKAESLSRIVAALALPIVLLVVGHMLEGPIREKESSLRLMEIAAGMLQADRSHTKDGGDGLRQWAVAVIEKHSGTPFPKEIKADLVSGKTQLPPNLPISPGAAGSAAGPWGVVFGGDKTLSAAQDEMKNAAKWGLADARIYLRDGMYRSVSYSADNASAQVHLRTAIANVPKRQPYLVNLSTWCPEPIPTTEAGTDITRCH